MNSVKVNVGKARLAAATGGQYTKEKIAEEGKKLIAKGYKLDSRSSLEVASGDYTYSCAIDIPEAKKLGLRTYICMTEKENKVAAGIYDRNGEIVDYTACTSVDKALAALPALIKKAALPYTSKLEDYLMANGFVRRKSGDGLFIKTMKLKGFPPKFSVDVTLHTNKGVCVQVWSPVTATTWYRFGNSKYFDPQDSDGITKTLKSYDTLIMKFLTAMSAV